MKLVSAILLSCAALIYAADQNTEAAKNPAPSGAEKGAPVYKKLGALTWDPDAHKLQWTVETGSLVDGEFVADSKDTYEISPDEATMGAAGERRGFDDEEAAELHQLLDILSLYCAESVEWWEGGAGTPLPSKPTDTEQTPSGKPVKVNQPPAKPPVPPVKVAPGQFVAELPPAR